MSEKPKLEDVVETVEAGEWLAYLEERFGLGRELFGDVLIFRQSTKVVSLARREIEPPAKGPFVAIGLPFLHVRGAVPKLTTVATMRFGPRATRNVVTLAAGQLGSFLERREIALESKQESLLTGPGHVIARYEGLVLGLGLYRREDEKGRLHGLMPKTWKEVQPPPTSPS